MSIHKAEIAKLLLHYFQVSNGNKLDFDCQTEITSIAGHIESLAKEAAAQIVQQGIQKYLPTPPDPKSVVYRDLMQKVYVMVPDVKDGDEFEWYTDTHGRTYVDVIHEPVSTDPFVGFLVESANYIMTGHTNRHTIEGLLKRKDPSFQEENTTPAKRDRSYGGWINAVEGEDPK